MALSVYDLKPRFQHALAPLLPLLARRGVTPDALTWTALAGSAALGLALGLGAPSRALLLAVPAWLLVRMALNALDGMLARQAGLASPRGAVLNELGDVTADAALYLPLAAYAPAARWSLVAFVLGGLLTELAGVLAQALGAGRTYQGPLGKSDRALVTGLLAALAAAAPATLRLWPAAFALLALLAVPTCRNRTAAVTGVAP